MLLMFATDATALFSRLLFPDLSFNMVERKREMLARKFLFVS